MNAVLSKHGLIICLVFLCVSIGQVHSKVSKYLVRINDENWRQILKDEWMIMFSFNKGWVQCTPHVFSVHNSLKTHAPWCSACNDLGKAWSSFADFRSVNVGSVDITESPDLSGRFLVTALPVIYHVKDGQFRTYNAPREKEEFVDFVEQKAWQKIQPVGSVKHPDTFQMSFVGKLFKASAMIRDSHSFLVEKKGLPDWASVGVLIVLTLILGCIMAYIVNFIADKLF